MFYVKALDMGKGTFTASGLFEHVGNWQGPSGRFARVGSASRSSCHGFSASFFSLTTIFCPV